MGDKHLFHPNDLKRYSLGTKNKNLKRNVDGSLTLYAGAKSPGAEKETNWLPAPGGHFSLYIRAYWGKMGILEGSWKPPVVWTSRRRCRLLRRVSDAGHDRRSHVHGGRRPKAAKERTRGR
jgi:hypothetical protein